MDSHNKINSYISKGIILSSFTFFLFTLSCEKIKPERILKVRTESISDIDYFSSTVGGTLIDVGDNGIDEHGHCWSTSANPTISNSRTRLGGKNSNGTFTSHLQELSPGTTYYIKAYAQKGDDVTYGVSKSFTTITAGLPTLNTQDVTTITMNTAECGGEITDENGYAITVRGVCWNSAGNPTIDDAKTSNGDGAGNYTSTLTGLSEGTTYYVKAYATNQLGTNYGNQLEFTTIDYPTVETSQISSINPSSAVCNGNVTNNGGAEITVRGICWGTSPDPTTADIISENGSGTGEYSGTLTGLEPATRYYARAYASHLYSTAYGEQMEFITPFTDERDSKTYQVVLIGNQYWMAENLNHGTFVTRLQGQEENEEIEKYCYNDNPYNCNVYGGLYNWNEMMQYVPSGEMIQGICPTGWHIPSDKEWKLLEKTIGMGEEWLDSVSWRGTDEGGKLKADGTLYWDQPNEGATNESGFSALPGGYYMAAGGITHLGIWGVFWTSDEFNEFTSWHRNLASDHADIYRYYYDKKGGFSVRCIKN